MSQHFAAISGHLKESDQIFLFFWHVFAINIQKKKGSIKSLPSRDLLFAFINY